jgi:hypothetical protein
MASTDNNKWVWRGGVLAAVVIGWLFILFHNSFHITPPVVFVCLGYFAAVATIYNLFRTGVSVVAQNAEDDGENAWGKPMGPRAELEREKRALLKAIKEAEFDHQMGKLSKADADEMIRTYRLRAIEVIKALEEAPGVPVGEGGTVREQIEREVRARLEVEGKPRKKGAADAEKKQEKQEQKKGHLTKKQRRAQEAARVAAAQAKAATAVAATEAEEPDADDDDDDVDDAADDGDATATKGMSKDEAMAKANVKPMAKSDAKGDADDAKVADAADAKASKADAADAKADAKHANGKAETAATVAAETSETAAKSGKADADSKEATP